MTQEAQALAYGDAALEQEVGHAQEVGESGFGWRDLAQIYPALRILSWTYPEVTCS